jgi:uncharacterized protein YxeA
MNIRKNLKILILTFIIFIQLLTVGCFLTFKDSQLTSEEFTQKAEEEITKNPKLKELDDLCKSLPVMESYSLKGKRNGNQKIFISYFYTSEVLKIVDWNYLKTSYIEYFEKLSWKLIAQNNSSAKYLEFKKDGKYVMISTAPDAGMGWGRNYAIECKEFSYSMVE